MRLEGSSFFSDHSFVQLKGQDWLTKQRVAGKVAAGAISLLVNMVKNTTNMTLLEMSKEAEKYIIDHDCSCTFKNYKGFPEAVCISVNNQLVHGIPTNYVLKDGDMVSFDLGATFEGAIADTAVTVIYGEPKPGQKHLIKTTEEALKKAIDKVKIGSRIGEIGNSIYKYAKSNGYNVVVPYGGHGLEWNSPHAQPFVANRALPTEGIRIQPGLTIAIEPLLTVGSADTWVDKDGWTVNCKSMCAHVEHTLYVHEDRVEIITLRESE